MIILHIGLPKTATTLIFQTLTFGTNVIVIPDLFHLEVINEMEKYNINYKNLNDNDKIIEFNKHDYGNYLEPSIPTVMSINYEDLDINNIYFIKNPLFVLDNYNLIVEKIKKAGHEVKIILGVRNIIDESYSLHYHWESLKLEINSCVNVLYNHILSRFYNNINNIIETLFNNDDAIIYNFDNLINYTDKQFILTLFNELKVPIVFNDNVIVKNILINKYEDTECLENSIENYTEIQNIYKHHFENIVFIHHLKDNACVYGYK